MDVLCERDCVDVLKDVFWWQMKWYQKVEGEFVNMLKAILPSFCRGYDGSDNGLKRISKTMKANMVPEVVKTFEKELSDSAQQKRELLDQFLLMLEKATKLLDAVLDKIEFSYSRLYDLIYDNSSKLPDEVFSVCQFLSRNNIF